MVEPASRRADVETVAVAARRSGVARVLADRWGIPVAYDRYQDLLQDPAVDAVYISNAASDHARWSVAALDAGKHVLVEKPAATTVRQAEEMAAAARRSGRRLLEAFHYRHHPLFAAVSAIARRANGGEIRHMSSVIIGHRPFEEKSVLHDPVVGGGALSHSGCYAVHWMRTLAGEEPVVVGATAERNPAGGDLSSIVDLAFPGGATGRIVSSFARDRDASDGPELAIDFGRDRLEVAGLIVPHAGHSIREWRNGLMLGPRTVTGGSSYDHQLAAFVRTLNDPRAAELDAVDLVAGATVLERAYAAMR
ncbi:Predicted dehydrogenase [Nakamurella panacisegetis]|uniref:Predicted dehydrogenase n=1 Tax=Nakamurella panacisegetis TaxID=1090615 RepID=A0A1H0IXX3_9ACTN|nr:Gfo/Idh/MocA family oxidoreductase [Nakamurella panacisegetis]SDO36338.1 Predicted dehydrogenase [Nakamurella panacisegetis]